MLVQLQVIGGKVDQYGVYVEVELVGGVQLVYVGIDYGIVGVVFVLGVEMCLCFCILWFVIVGM